MRTALTLAAILAAAATSPVRSSAQDPGGVTAEQVRQAIDNAITYLQRQQNPATGVWIDYGGYTGGATSLCTLALLNAGVPVDDAGIQKALAYLRKLPVEPGDGGTMNYVLALQTMVFCTAEPQRDLQLIARNVTILEERQYREGERSGGWDYNRKTLTIVDNSNSQFVLLALHEAERVGVPTSESTWKLARDYWQRTQSLDGSWGYRSGFPGCGSMTCAGVASLVMAQERLAEGDARVDGDQVDCCAARDDDRAIDLGIHWLTNHFSVTRNPGYPNEAAHVLYYLYGLERVGRLTNRRFFGKHDWYRIGAETLVNTQAKLGGGYWTSLGPGDSTEHIGTCFALLFLAKGRRPVLVSKLSHGDDDDWDHHRQDIANLTRYCEQKWRQDLTWQVVRSADATADDFNKAPVLFISGSESPNFSDQEAAAMRKYLDAGGFIFAENCCNQTGFDRGFRDLMARVFPERDQAGNLIHSLRVLPPQHSIWTAEEPVDFQNILDWAPLEGLDVGCRTSVVYCPKNLGCYWELDRLGRKQKFPDAVERRIAAMRSVGINVMAYATNRAVPYKLEIPDLPTEDPKQDAVERAKIYIAEARQAGAENIAPAALINLLKQLAVETGVRVSVEKRELALTQETIFDYHLVFMHGRSAFTLNEAERKNLKQFVERGGLLFADSVCSSEAFTTSFRREMALVFGQELKPIPGSHAMFGTSYGGFELGQVTIRDPRRAGGAGPLRNDVFQSPPELEGLTFARPLAANTSPGVEPPPPRYGVIFSRYDLSCALERQNSLECAGYGREDAAKIGINVILFSLRGNL